MLAPWKESYSQSRQHIKKQRHYFANKGPSSQSYGFSNDHVWMWKLDYKESWVPKNWCLWIVVLEKTLESPLDCKKIQLIHSKGNQSWIFIGRTHDEAETLILWSPDAKNWLIGKAPFAGKIEGRGEGDDRGWDGWMASPIQWTWVWVNSVSWWWKGSLACWSSWGHKESDMTERLNWTELNKIFQMLSESEVTHSCLSLCNPMNYSLQGSSVHRIFQAGVLEWVFISFSRGSSWPSYWTRVSHIADRHFTVWATREAHFRC